MNQCEVKQRAHIICWRQDPISLGLVFTDVSPTEVLQTVTEQSALELNYF